MVSTQGDPCGIADHAQRLAGALRPEPHVDILSVDAELRAGGDAFFRALGRRANAYDLVHVQYEASFFGGGIAPPRLAQADWLWRRRPPAATGFFAFAREISVPLLLGVHEIPLLDADGFRGRRFRRGLARALLRQANLSVFEAADRVLVFTRAQRALLEALGLARSRITQIPCGLPAVAPAPARDAARRDLGVDGRFALALVGFVGWRKGHQDALDLLAELPEPAVLLVAGGRHPQDRSDYCDRFADRIRRLGLEARVRVTGYLPPARLAAALAASDVVLAPYRGVLGASSSLLLAIAHDRPVLGWDLPALRELAERFPGVELHPSGAIAPLRERVAALMASAEERARLCARAVCPPDAFRVEGEAARIRATYDELLAAPRARRRADAAFGWPRALLRSARAGGPRARVRAPNVPGPGC